MAPNTTATDDAQTPLLDADDLAEGDVVELDLLDGRTARYRVREEFEDDDLADLDAYENPAEEAVGKVPGLHVERVWSSSTYDPDRRLPRYRGTLVLDADRQELVHNWNADDEDRGYLAYGIRAARTVEIGDRWTVEGSVGSSAARHVVRVVADAFENDPLVSTIEVENVTIKGADASGTGVLGGDLGLTVYILASLDLHVREAFESYLHDHLNEGYWFEVERDGVFTFLYDGENGTRPVR